MKKHIIPYNKKLVKIAKELRQNLTFAEARLWKNLNRKQLLGYDFDRQKPIGNYIVDFYCYELKLVIELDGASHGENSYENDLKRENDLISLGLKVLRFEEKEIFRNINGVLQTIVNYIENQPTPTPPKRGDF